MRAYGELAPRRGRLVGLVDHDAAGPVDELGPVEVIEDRQRNLHRASPLPATGCRGSIRRSNPLPDRRRPAGYARMTAVGSVPLTPRWQSRSPAPRSAAGAAARRRRSSGCAARRRHPAAGAAHRAARARGRRGGRRADPRAGARRRRRRDRRAPRRCARRDRPPPRAGPRSKPPPPHRSEHRHRRGRSARRARRSRAEGVAHHARRRSRGPHASRPDRRRRDAGSGDHPQRRDGRGRRVPPSARRRTARSARDRARRGGAVVADARASSATDAARLRDADRAGARRSRRAEVLDAATEESRQIVERGDGRGQGHPRRSRGGRRGRGHRRRAPSPRPAAPEPAKSRATPRRPGPGGAPTTPGVGDPAVSSTSSPRTTPDDRRDGRAGAPRATSTTSTVAVAPAEAKPTNGVLANGTKNSAAPKDATPEERRDAERGHRVQGGHPSRRPADRHRCRHRPQDQAPWRIFGRAKLAASVLEPARSLLEVGQHRLELVRRHRSSPRSDRVPRARRRRTTSVHDSVDEPLHHLDRSRGCGPRSRRARSSAAARGSSASRVTRPSACASVTGDDAAP